MRISSLFRGLHSVTALVATRKTVHIRVALMVPLIALAACEAPVVTWLDEYGVRTDSPSPLAHPPLAAWDTTMNAASPEAGFLETQDRLRDAGAVSLLTERLAGLVEADDLMATAGVIPAQDNGRFPLDQLGSGPEPMDPARCARSLRIVTATTVDPRGGFGYVATWWTRVSGGRVFLVAAWRDSVPGEPLSPSWRGPIPVDTLDQGPLDAEAADRGAYGCARPAPGLAVDSINGYVHIAYSLTGPEGSGVFYAHQMAPYTPFEPPVAVLYGSRLGAARVASDGDVVAVAFDDPNSMKRGRIGVAVSHSQGHVFEARLMASTGNASAVDPYVVVRGRSMLVGWSELVAADIDAEPVFVFRRAVVH